MSDEFRAVLFDLGGTLWDAFGGASRDQVTRDAATGAATAILGSRAPQEQLEKLRLGILWRLNALRPAREAAAKASFSDPVFREDDISTILAEAAAPFGGTVTEDVAMAFGHDLTRHDKPFPETLPVLRRMRAARPDLVIGIVSNTVVQPAVIDHYLGCQGLLEIVDFRVLSSELGWRKPHPAIYSSALAKAGVGPKEALFVGDRVLEDVMGPARAGIRAVLRSQGGESSELPLACRPMAVISDLEGILPLLSIT